MIVETIRTIKTERFTVLIQAVDYCQGSHWFDELYTPSCHIAGTTIKLPSHLTRGKAEHFIGQYTPAELARDYAEQGRENPSYAAYKSLQDELAHYVQASDCALQCKVFKAGVELASETSLTFDYSIELNETFEEYAALMLKEYGREFISEAITAAKNKLTELKA